MNNRNKDFADGYASGYDDGNKDAMRNKDAFVDWRPIILAFIVGVLIGAAAL